ncbi:MAG: hypothetical protein LBV40_04060 [Methanomicrobiales archaeon]|jgi:hypothetical protein|nr:hypothetical protein [Methanomicrobiales archaeon]
MEREDVMVIVAAIAIVLLMAVVFKPLITGQSATFLPEKTLEEEQTFEAGWVDMESTQPTYSPALTQVPDPIPTQHSTPTFSPTQTPSEPVGMTWQPDPENPMPNIQMTNYAEIVGRYSGATEKFVIPVPYWEVHYEIGYDEVKTPEFSIDVHEIENGIDSIIRTMTFKPEKKPDPVENRFYKGGYTYYISINAKDITQYKIQIMVPEKYIAE